MQVIPQPSGSLCSGETEDTQVEKTSCCHKYYRGTQVKEWIKLLLGKHGDWSCNPRAQANARKHMVVTYNPIPGEAETGEPQGKLTSKSSQNQKALGSARDPAAINKAERDQG